MGIFQKSLFLFFSVLTAIAIQIPAMANLNLEKYVDRLLRFDFNSRYYQNEFYGSFEAVGETKAIAHLPLFFTEFDGTFIDYGKICIDFDSGQCTLSEKSSDLIKYSYKRSRGRSYPDEYLKNYNFFDIFKGQRIVKRPERGYDPLIKITSSLRFVNGKLQISIVSDYLGIRQKYKLVVNYEKNLSEKIYKFKANSPDEKYQISLRIHSKKLKRIKKNMGGVVQIVENMSYGTGFYISKYGHLITNHHVLKNNEDCYKFTSCSIKLRHDLPTGASISYEADAELLIHDSVLDIVLLKVNIPRSFRPFYTYLRISQEPVSSIYTMGYPSNKRIDYRFQKHITFLRKKIGLAATIDFSFSIGHVVGADVNTPSIVTTALGHKGTSGSPVFNFRDNKVIGIVTYIRSDKYRESDLPGIGHPILMVPIDYFLDRYNLRSSFI